MGTDAQPWVHRSRGGVLRTPSVIMRFHVREVAENVSER